MAETDLLLASQNPGKLAEMKELVAGLPFRVLSPADLGIRTAPEETGASFIENAILKALPQMAEAAQSEELKGALAVHLRETEGQLKRLEQVFQSVGERPEGVECKAIQGIIEEGQEILRAFQGGEASDAGLIAAAQAVKHYEITRYGTLLAWAKQLGLSEAEGLLQETLIEEENTDELLSDLAEDAINPAAAAA